MSIRDYVNANQNIVVVAAAVIIVVALIFIVMQSGGGYRASGPGDAYYIDSVTKEIFTDDAQLYPPIQSPDGNPAYRVYIYSFTDCGKKEDRFIAYYERYTDEAKQKLEAASKTGDPMADDMMMMELAEMGLQYSVDGEKWYPSTSDQFMMLADEKIYREDGFAKPCRVK